MMQWVRVGAWRRRQSAEDHWLGGTHRVVRKAPGAGISGMLWLDGRCVAFKVQLALKQASLALASQRHKIPDTQSQQDVSACRKWPHVMMQAASPKSPFLLWGGGMEKPFLPGAIYPPFPTPARAPGGVAVGGADPLHPIPRCGCRSRPP